jgi:hypothetical protein
MNKFGKPTDEEYQTVCDVIVEMVEETLKIIPTQAQCK